MRDEGTSSPCRRSVLRAQGRSISPTPAHTLACTRRAHQHLRRPQNNKRKLTATASKPSPEIPTVFFSFLPAGLATLAVAVLVARGVVSTLGALRGVTAFGDGAGEGTEETTGRIFFGVIGGVADGGVGRATAGREEAGTRRSRRVDLPKGFDWLSGGGGGLELADLVGREAWDWACVEGVSGCGRGEGQDAPRLASPR